MPVLEAEGASIFRPDPFLIICEIHQEPDKNGNIELMNNMGLNFETPEDADEIWNLIKSSDNPLAYFKSIREAKIAQMITMGDK